MKFGAVYKGVRRSSSTPVNASNPGPGFYCAPVNDWRRTRKERGKIRDGEMYEKVRRWSSCRHFWTIRGKVSKVTKIWVSF